MIDTDKYEAQLEDDNTELLVLRQIAKESLAEVKHLLDYIDDYEMKREPKLFDEIEQLKKRLERALKSDNKYNAVVDACGNAGRGSIMVDVTFDDGE